MKNLMYNICQRNESQITLLLLFRIILEKKEVINTASYLNLGELHRWNSMPRKINVHLVHDWGQSDFWSWRNDRDKDACWQWTLPRETHVPAPRTSVGMKMAWLYLPCYLLLTSLYVVDIFITCMPTAVSFGMKGLLLLQFSCTLF